MSCTPSTSTDATGYYFYRGIASGQESSVALNAGTPSATCSYDDTTVAGNTTYYYVAKTYCATCGTSLSVASNEISTTTPADAQPNPPTGLTLGPVSRNSVPLLWQPPVAQSGYGVSSYQVFRGLQATMLNPVRIGIVNSNQLSYIDKHCRSICYYYVKAQDIFSQTSYVLSGPSNIVAN